MNALVAPGEQLCFLCHDLGTAKRYVHGPIASGGCLVCHDPHRSQYRHLLVSDAVGFCLHCHDRAALRPVAGHAAAAGQCTDCHEAHMSDRRYLLR
jgi:predicted CXXCH cytochrome family protein